MRILVANANTTQAITDACVAAARRVAGAGTEIIGATPAFGPQVIATMAENAIAAHALLESLASHAGQVDAAILAVSHDTALDAARQLMPCPVIGMTEAACLTACMLGGRFALLSLGAITAPYELLVERHGLASRCVEVRGVGATPQDALTDPARVQALLLQAIEVLARRADAIVLGGAALAGFDQQLQPRAPVPLLDGIPCAVKLAEALVGLGLPKQSVGPYAPPQGRATSGLSGPLAALLGG